MPQTDTGILLIVGAIFFLIGLLGGEFEIRDVKISSSTGLATRIIAAGVGMILLGIAVSRFIFPSAPVQVGVTPIMTPPVPTIALAESTPARSPQQPEPGENSAALTNTPIPEPTNPPPPQPTMTPSPAPIRTPPPTTAMDADPMMYDNFNNPAHDGSFDGDKWWLNNRDGICTVYQREGVLVFSMDNTSSQTDKGCILSGPEEILGNRLDFYEAKIRLPEYSKEGVVTFLTMSSDGFTEGGWMECGLGQYRDGVAAFFAINTHGGKVSELGEDYPLETDSRWYTIRYEIEPDTMQVSCLVDDKLVGTTIPKDAPHLKTSVFYRYIQTNLSPGVTADTFLDDVRMKP